jgi:hypothetical protein
MKHLQSLLLLALLVHSLISCGRTTCPRVEIPKTPEPKACTLTIAPPKLSGATFEDFAKSGERECGPRFEVCLTRKAALHYVQLQQYADEVWSVCRK